jgi:transcription elongation GreA/GreB family factor/membrane associated rhomboid family serine protease
LKRRTANNGECRQGADAGRRPPQAERRGQASEDDRAPGGDRAIEEARAHGDLSENAEYHAAKERQGQVEATIADLEDRLSRAMVIDPDHLSGDKVVFGATVTLRDEDDKQVRYQLVGRPRQTPRSGGSAIIAARQGADRPPGRRRGRGIDPVGRPLLQDRGDRIRLTLASGKPVPRTATFAVAAVTALAGLLIWRSAPRPMRGADGLHSGAAQRRVEVSPAVWPLLTPLSATLVHAGLLHLAFNLLMLIWCGLAVERILGGGAVVFLYVVGAYVAAAADWLVAPGSLNPGIGASGAISAVLGTFAMMFSQQRQLTRSPRPKSLDQRRLAACRLGS